MDRHLAFAGARGIIGVVRPNPHPAAAIMGFRKFFLTGAGVFLLGASAVLGFCQDQKGDAPAAGEPPKVNPNTPPGPAPAGMVWIPGGECYMGIAKNQLPKGLAIPDLFQDAAHVHKVFLDGYWMDKTE